MWLEAAVENGNPSQVGGVRAHPMGPFEGCSAQPSQEFDWWFSGAQCSGHPDAAASICCDRCGSFCCRECVDFAEPSRCHACGVLLVRARRTAQARSIALKLALAPAIVVLAWLIFAARLKGVPWIFGVWLAPLGCAIALARTERAGLAWIGVAASVAIALWFAVSLAWLEHWSPLVDVALLAAAPLLALPGCARLTRTVAELRFAESR